ncbi:MAG: WD40/YVTN/BNR-like repeat-containing protein [Anaerolineaceae bacterium]
MVMQFRLLLAWLFVAVLTVFSNAVSAWGNYDLLSMPAQKSSKAPFSLLMDVTKADHYLVAVGERGHILVSENGGESWSQSDVPVSVTLTAVTFPIDQEGWAVGHDGVVLHSEDCGKSWKKQLDGSEINELMLFQLNQVINNKTEELKNAEQMYDDKRVEALRQKLQNLHFFLNDVKLAIDEGPSRPLMDVWFRNNREGIVIGSFGMILQTTDGGNTWKPIMDRIDNSDGLHYYAITRSGDDLFIAGEAGMLFKSTDFGHNWRCLHAPYDGSFFGIAGSQDGSLVVAFGLRGRIFCSYDRGDNWIPLKNTNIASLSAGIFLSDGSFCLAGVDGCLLQSLDKGKTLIQLPTKFSGIISLTEIDNGNLVLVGRRGTTKLSIYKLREKTKGSSNESE